MNPTSTSLSPGMVVGVVAVLLCAPCVSAVVPAKPAAARFDEATAPTEAQVAEAQAKRLQLGAARQEVAKAAGERAKVQSGLAAAQAEMSAATTAARVEYAPVKRQSAPEGYVPPTADQEKRVQAAIAAFHAARHKFDEIYAADEALRAADQAALEASHESARLSNARNRATLRTLYREHGYAPLTPQALSDAGAAEDGKTVALLDCVIDRVDGRDRRKVPGHTVKDKRLVLTRDRLQEMTRLHLRDADGTAYGPVYVDRSTADSIHTRPGTPVDVYGWVVRLDDGTMAVVEAQTVSVPDFTTKAERRR
ncbi:MAG TPA: hypothetical protein VK986_12095 [Tepidisphaeraceae bacterium]|nr:hypothetical protein [Tepidisphaeraceae bacterium]